MSDTQPTGSKITACFSDKKAVKLPPLHFKDVSEEKLRQFNSEGYGVFETVNEFFAGRRIIENLSKLRAIYGELDVCKDENPLLEEEREKRKNHLIKMIESYCPATTYIITKNGVQPKWDIDEPNNDEATREKYSQIIKGVIEWTKQHGNMGDDVTDVTRVLRKPGYYHNKSQPYLITERRGSGKMYRLDELKKYFWIESRQQPTQEQKSESDNPTYRAIDELDIKKVVIDVWKEKGHEVYFDDKHGHLWVDGKDTATFKGRKGNGNYMATSSRDYPAKGNAITYVATTLEKSNKEAFQWLIEKYNIDDQSQSFHTNTAHNNQSEESRNRHNAKDKQRDNWQFFTADDLKKKDLPPPEFVVAPLIVKDGINMISGDPASMKSMVIVHIAIQIAKGEKVFGKFDTKQSGTLVVDDENGERELKKRFDKLGAFTTSLPLHYIAYPEPPMVFELADVQYLINKCKELDVSVIIFDSYVRFLGGKDENTSGDTSEINRILKEFVKVGITVIFIHHHRKAGLVKAKGGQEARGSSDLLAGVNSHLVISKKKDGLIIKQVKLREEKQLEPFEVRVVDSENNTKLAFEYVGEVKPEADLLEEAKTAILDILSQSDRPLYTKEISDAVSEAVGIGKKTSDNALKELVSEKSVQLDPTKHEKNRNYYYLPDDQPTNNDPVNEIQQALDQL